MLLKNILELLKNKEALNQIKIISEEIKKTNQILIEIKKLLSTNQVNILKNDLKSSLKKTKSKEYIPDPNVSNITISNKKIKEESTDSNNISDTLESLSKLNLQEKN